MSNQKKLDKLSLQAEQIVKEFKLSQQYKNNLKILQQAKKAVDYYEGRQWDDYTGSNKDEKIVMNQIKPIVDGKLASINSKQYKLNFSVDNDMVSTKKLTKFTAWQMSDLGQNKINLRASKEALIKGTAFSYFYWNEDKVGQMGQVEGGIEHSFVDIKDIAFANPNELDIQKQEYIIVRSRESIRNVKKSCDTLSDKEKERLIQKKEYISVYSKDYEQNDNDMCNVYTKFFKKDNEVFFEKCTDEVLFQKARSLNPLSKEYALEEEKDIQNETMDLLDEKEINFTEEEKLEEMYKASVYPFNLLSFEERDGSIFGLSYVTDLIPIQRSINQLIMVTQYGANKSIQPTVVVKDGAFKLSTLDLSKGGKVIVDHSGFGVPINNVISLLQQGNLPTAHYQLAQSLTAFTKDTYRASEVLDDGRNIASGLSGDAIANLNYLQEKPIAQWQEKLARFVEEEGKILEMFYKLYYRNKNFSSELSDSELIEFKEKNQEMISLYGEENITKTQPDIFDGEEYLNTPFHIKVEVLETSRSSEQSMFNILQLLYLNGVINNLKTVDILGFIEMCPDNIFPKKEEWKRILMKRDADITQQMAQQLDALAKQNAQLQNIIGNMQKEMQAKNKGFNDSIKNLTSEYNEQLRQLGIMSNNTQKQQ